MQWFTKVKEFLRSFGPGIILASVVLGPGSITVSSTIGSEHGYAFLWVIVISIISMLIYTSMGVRFGVVNQKTILQSIAENYGRWFSIIIGISAFLAASSFQFGNNLGVGVAMEGITGIDERIWPLIFTPSAIVLLFWAKNLYKVLEKLMMLLVLIMILAFFFNLVLTKPSVGDIAGGFVPHTFSFDNLQIIAALVGTTFVLHGALYQSYLAQSKGWSQKNMRQGLNDSLAGNMLLALISMLIIITSAAALHPKGIVVKSAADMALQLESLFGSYAKVVFSIGLCAAAFSSLMVNAVMGGGLLADGLGLGKSMNEKMPKVFTTIALLMGMIIAVFFRGNVIYTLIMAQASSILAVPFIAIGMFLILNNKKVMGKLKNNLWQNIVAVFGFILISLMVYYMYSKIIGYLNSL